MTTNPQTPAQLRAEAERVDKLILEYETTLKTYKELGAREDWCHGETFEALHAARLKMETEFLKVGNPSLARAHAALLAAHAEALEQDRWIPVEERLPEEGVWVLVVTHEVNSLGYFRYAQTAYLLDGEWHQVNGSVRHWRPLPTPPAPASAEGGVE